MLIAKDACNLANSVVLLNENGKLKVIAIAGFPEDVLKLSLDIKKGEGITGFSAKRRKTIVVNDITKSRRYIVGVPGAKSELAVPLIVNNQVLGVLNLESVEKNAFSKTCISSAQALATIIGFMILSFESQKKLEKVIKMLKALAKSLNKLNNAVKLSQTLSAIIKTVKDYFDYKYFDILLKNQNGELVPTKTSKDFPISVIKGFKAEINSGEGLTGTAAKLGKIICVNDVTKDKRYIPAIKGINSEAVFPIKVGGELIGVLDIEDTESNRFQKDDIQILSALSSEIGVAIQNAQLYEKVQELATTDELTGLSNYRAFRRFLDLEVKRAKRYNKNFSLVMFDIDYFKHYNDKNGHDQGNSALKKIGEILIRENRNSDFPARFGGEEFIVILPETSVNGALQYAERIRKAIEKTKFKGERHQPNGKLTISGGVAEFPIDSDTAAKIIKAVDAACYEAKASGRNMIAIFGESDANNRT